MSGPPVLRRWAWPGLLALALTLACHQGWLEPLELLTQDARLYLRGWRLSSSDVVVVGMTRQCYEALGEPPWPRTRYAALIDRLAAAGARVIGLDVFFASPARDPAEDQALQQAMRGAGNVILPVFSPAELGSELRGPVRPVRSLVRSTPELAAAAAGSGHINVPPGRDGRARGVPLALEYRGQIHFALGLEAAAQFLARGGPPGQGLSTGELLAARGVPVTEDGDLLIDYAGQQHAFDFFPFSQVLEGRFEPAAVRGKLVLVGQTAQGRVDADRLATPLGSMYGVFLQGVVADNLLTHRHLRRQGRTSAALVSLGLAVASWLLLARLAPRHLFLAGAAACALVWGTAILLFVHAGWFVELVLPSLVLLGNVAGGALVSLKRSGEMARSRELQLGQLVQSTRVTADAATVEATPQALARLVGTALGADAVTLHWAPDRTTWDWLAPLPPESGADARVDTRRVRRFEQSVMPGLLREARPLVAASRDDCAVLAAEELPPLPFVSVPLVRRGEVAGFLNLYGKVTTPTSPGPSYRHEDVRLVALFAQQAALLLENGMLLRDLEARNRAVTEALTQLQQAQDELVRREKLSAVGTMVAMLMHDLRGPITAASCTAELLREPGQSPAELHAGVETILQELQRINAMAQEVLDYARGLRHLTVTSVSAAELAQDVRARLSRERPAGEDVLQLDIQGEDHVAADRGKIANVLLNLVRNGLDATGGRGPVTLRARPVSAGVEFAVADGGPGIPEEVRGRLFEPFVSWGKAQGTGLGLAIARKTVQDHGGTIRAESPPAGGTVFLIVLPRAPRYTTEE